MCIRDSVLDGLTDVAKKFPNRHRKDGRYYVIDFTLKEIQSLNMKMCIRDSHIPAAERTKGIFW